MRARSGPATLLLVLAVLSIGGMLAARHSAGVSAQSAPTRVARATATGMATAPVTPTAKTVPTATPTRRPPTPTWTPLPTVAAADSPLATPAAVMLLPLAAAHSPLPTPAAVVPLPATVFGPHLVPRAPLTGTAPITATEAPAADAAPIVSLLPTPTPLPTRTITDALAQPLPSGGLGAAVATAESALPTPTALPTTPPPVPTPAVAAEPTPDGAARSAQVPVLMYHYLSVPPANADAYRRDLSVAPDLFAAQLDAMLAAGYTTITPHQLMAHLAQGAPLPEKSVVLTFDDGYRDNYENALPRLRERGMVAAFFVVTDFIDEQRPEYLTWDMLREMAAAGMAIESHGRNHVSLKNKDYDYLVWQALGSLETIQYELGVRPRFVSYPAGDYDQLTVDVFRSAGYWAGFTTQQGATHRSDDLFQLRRVRVRGTTSADEIVRLLGLDW